MAPLGFWSSPPDFAAGMRNFFTRGVLTFWSSPPSRLWNRLLRLQRKGRARFGSARNRGSNGAADRTLKCRPADVVGCHQFIGAVAQAHQSSLRLDERQEWYLARQVRGLRCLHVGGSRRKQRLLVELHRLTAL